GRIASAVAKTRENRALPDKNHQISAIQAQFQQPGRLKSDRLLVVVTGKTNCRQTQTGVAQEICCSGNVHRNAEDVLADEIEDFTQACSIGVLETAA
ncbi:hypothetical protein ACLIIZ_13925, partial [Azonexus caeni]|uniref:hypothetical protein n=1 Tax=Azonexus caeni TaxID=266126 RepID=UPI003A89DB53